MSYMWFVGSSHPVNTHPDVVRSTLDETETSRAAQAEIDAPPAWNEFASDKDTALVGLSPRQMSGDVNPSEHYRPWWIPLAEQNHNEIVDNRIADSGTAAAREDSGSFGHGTAEFTRSLEPVIRDGAAYGNDYFVRGGALIQDGAGSYMGSSVPDIDWKGVAAYLGEKRSRQAYAGLYDSLIG